MNEGQEAYTRIKICGLTSVEDVRKVVSHRVDAIGMVFFEKSPRNISIDTAVNLAKAAGPFVTTVGLFVNPKVQFVQNVIEQVPLQLLQFHGDESPEFCAQFNRPYIKALRVKKLLNNSSEKTEAEIDAEVQCAKQKIIQEAKIFSGAQGILLDTYSEKGRGGTGESFNWDCVPESLPNTPIILAGGLSAENISSAVQQTRPYAVDVSSGVESSPGQKDYKKITRFVQAVQACN